jgi:hypothetical protein
MSLTTTKILSQTYGIPTISDLLVATRMFSNPENASKRYEDTTILIGEYVAHHPQAERTLKSIARMNYLHGPYIKSGKIRNEDLLYTLSVFITEPIYWINKFEWRNLTEYEVCALGTFWKSIGDAMGIDYKHLKREIWQDGVEFYEDIKEWAQYYEAEKMVPTTTNKQTTDELVPLLLHYVPRALFPFSQQVIGVFMGERLRWAMMYVCFKSHTQSNQALIAILIVASRYPEPSALVHSATFTVLLLRRFFLRHLTLPRIFPLEEFSDKDPKTQRYYHKNYLVHPYYVKPSFINRWGATAWVTRALGGIVPGGKHGSKYHPEGYLFEELGPNRKRGIGKKEMDFFEPNIQRARPAGCPFAAGR